MRLKEARIKPVTDEELTDEQTEILETVSEAARDVIIFRTSLRAPTAMKAILPWSNYLGSKKTCSLPWRQRELIVLRSSFMCTSGYEWSHHTYLGERAGLEKIEIAALRNAVEEHVWDDEDQALIDMCDELATINHVRDDTWNKVAKFYDQKQLMDAVYTSSYYQMVSKYTNAFGMQIDKGLTLDDGLSDFAES